MAKYDPDRIAALAAGSLDPAEAAILEAEIAADPRAAAELAAQRFALDFLRQAPAPVLSADERTELRRAVSAALHLDEGAPAAAATARRRLPWRPLAVAAAALAALVAVVPLVGLLSVGGDDKGAETTIALSATTVADAEEFATSGMDGNLTVEGSEAVPLGSVAPAERAMDDADQTIAALLEDPSPLVAADPAPTIPCRDDAVILLAAEDSVGVLLPQAQGALAVWYLPGEGRAFRQLVAFDALTCQFLAAYP